MATYGIGFSTSRQEYVVSFCPVKALDELPTPWPRCQEPLGRCFFGVPAGGMGYTPQLMA